MTNSSGPESRAKVMQELKIRAAELASQRTRPTPAQVLEYFAIAKRLPEPDFSTSFAAERAGDTPTY